MEFYARRPTSSSRWRKWRRLGVMMVMATCMTTFRLDCHLIATNVFSIYSGGLILRITPKTWSLSEFVPLGECSKSIKTDSFCIRNTYWTTFWFWIAIYFPDQKDIPRHISYKISIAKDTALQIKFWLLRMFFKQGQDFGRYIWVIVWFSCLLWHIDFVMSIVPLSFPI